MILATFHGGSEGVSNIYAYSDSGEVISTGVLNKADDFLHHAKLRDIVFCDEYLYVVNGRRRKSQIIRFKGTGIHYDFEAIYTSHEDISSIDHPFAITFDKKLNYCYISNQDSNVVVRLVLESGKPAPLASALPACNKFLPGTFVASSSKKLPGVQKTKSIHTHQGLKLDLRNNIIYHSVRSVLLYNDMLYVCDEQAGMVKIYNREGILIYKSSNLEKPTHLLVSKGFLYVSCKKSIQVASLKNKVSLSFKPIKTSSGGISGMTVNENLNYFYAADRKLRKVYLYNIKSRDLSEEKVIIENMPDNPEFLLYLRNI